MQNRNSQLAPHILEKRRQTELSNKPKIEKPETRQFVPIAYQPSWLCMSCGSLVNPRTKFKLSNVVGLGLLVISFFLLVLSPVLAMLVFFGFLIYCIVQIATQYKGCPFCGQANIIPVNSPMAQKYISNLNP